MKNDAILRTISRFMSPIIMILAVYIQINGDYSPGGGFQAGVILASAMILCHMIFGCSIISLKALRILAAFGVLLYAGTGIAAMLCNGEFLNYSVLARDSVLGQNIGIFLIELGVGITVYSVMFMIYLTYDREF